MGITKLERTGGFIRDLKGWASAEPAATITLDALTVHKLPLTAAILGRLWQHISNCEIRAKAVDAEYENGWENQGEEVDCILWNLHQGDWIKNIPRTARDGDSDEEYDDWLIKDAMKIARSAIVDAIYVEVQDDNH